MKDGYRILRNVATDRGSTEGGLGLSLVSRFQRKAIHRSLIDPPTGVDLEPEVLELVLRVQRNDISGMTEWQVAQMEELAFWRWVAFEGYAGRPSIEFVDHQRTWMTENLRKAGWLETSKFECVVELGSGPIGMVEFVSAESRVAIDPLNGHYSRLFARNRQPSTLYATSAKQLGRGFLADAGICFNVLDHTADAEIALAEFRSLLSDGANFILQVNTVKQEYPRSDDHRKMHPSSMSSAQVLNLLDHYGFDFDFNLEEVPTADNEFPLLAWGRLNRRRTS